jgi:Mce-associated membrane protein
MRVSIAVIVLALAAAVWFLVDQKPPPDNSALVDTATTSQVKGQVRTAIENSFSYDYTDTARTEKAARNVLVGDAMRQYEQLFGQVRTQAAAQKLVLVSTVRAVAVRELHNDDATLLVFVDQQAVRTGDNGNTSTSAQLRVVAHRTADTWRVTGLTVL